MQEFSVTLNSRHRATMLLVGVQVIFVITLCLLSLFGVVDLGLDADPSTMTTLWTLVLFLTIGSFLLRRLFNGWERLRDTAILGGTEALVKRMQLNALITCACGTLAAMVGFAAAQISGDAMDMMRSAAVAFIVFFANYPRKAVWKAVVNRIQQNLDV